MSLGEETILLVPVNKTIFIIHCSRCDTLGQEDTFLEWLQILIIGTKVKIADGGTHVDLKHVLSELQCKICNNNLVTQVIFEWISTNDSENKA